MNISNSNNSVRWTPKSTTVPGTGVIESITTVSLTPLCEPPLEPGDTATPKAPRALTGYSVKLRSGEVVADKIEEMADGAHFTNSIALSRLGPRWGEKEVPHTHINVLQGGFELDSDENEQHSDMREFVSTDGTIRMLFDTLRDGDRNAHYDVEVSPEGGVIAKYSDPPDSSGQINSGEYEIPAWEGPDGSITLKPFVDPDKLLVVQPYLTREDVNAGLSRWCRAGTT